ncbi:hypothetical protein F3Y22_tig00006230pilonHSYRG00011 [Hibiscus syriacus]|uniref:Cytosolic endo-beta-N-acetylglucosaminidase TIM barrel domain-containing protein n=1 Tax=Hibiscus syriacus TaxID=106335 RepID=A0A6A3CDH8_HIBSY|nr:hypothetical protein F3Y22_tig00006230pilonHSYRG00011 [Hibiscus syriacus]
MTRCLTSYSELAVAWGFDGWLLNMEVDLDIGQIPNLKEFISRLTQTMHSSVPGSLVIWYVSLTVDGTISYQNQLYEQKNLSLILVMESLPTIGGSWTTIRSNRQRSPAIESLMSTWG